MKKITEMKRKAMTLLGTTMLCCLCWGNVAFAINYGQNISNVFFDNLFYIALVIIGLVAVKLFTRENTVGMIMTVIVGGVILFFIKNPTKLETIGTNIGNMIFQ